jgi:hypothetical protein
MNMVKYLSQLNLDTLQRCDKGDGKFNNLVEELTVLLGRVLDGEDVTKQATEIYNKVKTASTDNKAATTVLLVSTALMLLDGGKNIERYKEKTASAAARLHEDIDGNYANLMKIYNAVENGELNG